MSKALEILRDGLVEKTRELQQELSALQSLVVEYLEAKDSRIEFPITPQVYQEKLSAAEAALRAAVPN